MNDQPAPAVESFFDPGGGVSRGWRTSLGAMVCLAAGPGVLLAMAFGTFAPHLRTAFGWSVAEVSSGITILSIMLIVVSLLSGVLVDRFGPRRMILPSVPLFGLGFAAMALMDGSLWQFRLAFVILPLLGIGLWPGAWVRATSSWFDRRLGMAVAVTTLGIGLGAALVPLAANTIMETRGWRAAYAGLGLGSILIVWPVAFFFVRDGARTAGARTATRLADIAPLFRGRALWLLMATFVCLGAFSTTTLANLVSVLEAKGLSPHAAVGAQAVLGLSTIGGRLLCGWLLDRWSIRIVGTGLALPAALALLIISLSASGTTALICAPFLGLLIGGELDVLGFAVKRYFGLAHYGMLYGLIFAMFNVGSATGAMAMGAAYARTGQYDLGIGIAALAGGVAAVFFALLPRYSREPRVHGPRSADA